MVQALICDDEPDIRLLYRAAFERAGAAVLMAADGDECLTVASRRQPELVVLDLRMPGRDGLAVLTELLAASPASKVVVVSAYASVDAFDRARRNGAVECFDKMDFLWRIPDLVATHGAAA